MFFSAGSTGGKSGRRDGDVTGGGRLVVRALDL